MTTTAATWAGCFHRCSHFNSFVFLSICQLFCQLWKVYYQLSRFYWSRECECEFNILMETHSDRHSNSTCLLFVVTTLSTHVSWHHSLQVNFIRTKNVAAFKNGKPNDRRQQWISRISQVVFLFPLSPRCQSVSQEHTQDARAGAEIASILFYDSVIKMKSMTFSRLVTAHGTKADWMILRRCGWGSCIHLKWVTDKSVVII